MKLTDKDAIKALNKLGIYELWDMIDIYPEDERDGRTDWEMVANEASYLLSCCDEEGHTHKEDLDEARELLKLARRGLRKHGLKLSQVVTVGTPYGRVYRRSEIDDAIRCVQEYNRLKRFVAKLDRMGIYIPW